MLKDKLHKVLMVLSFILVVSLLVPSAVKLAHVFEDHKHEVCLDTSTTHLHTLDIDCEFYKFNISNPLLIPNLDYEIPNLSSDSTLKTSGLYNFKYNHQQLYFSLRAPPSLVM